MADKELNVPVVRYYEQTKAVIVAVNGYPIHLNMSEFPEDVVRKVVARINTALHDAAAMDSLLGETIASGEAPEAPTSPKEGSITETVVKTAGAVLFKKYLG